MLLRHAWQDWHWYTRFLRRHNFWAVACLCKIQLCMLNTGRRSSCLKVRRRHSSSFYTSACVWIARWECETPFVNLSVHWDKKVQQTVTYKARLHIMCLLPTCCTEDVVYAIRFSGFVHDRIAPRFVSFLYIMTYLFILMFHFCSSQHTFFLCLRVNRCFLGISARSQLAKL